MTDNNIPSSTVMNFLLEEEVCSKGAQVNIVFILFCYVFRKLHSS